DLGALLVGDAGGDQVRGVEDLHGGSYREMIMYVARPTAHSLPAASVTLASPKAIVRPRRRILPSAKIGPWPAAARKLTLRSRVDWLTPPAAASLSVPRAPPTAMSTSALMTPPCTGAPTALRRSSRTSTRSRTQPGLASSTATPRWRQ